jgi:hypothetical protein
MVSFFSTLLPETTLGSDGLSEQDTVRFGIEAPSKPCVLIVVGGTMNPWFVRSCAFQAQRLADRYYGKILVCVATQEGQPKLDNYFKGEHPLFTMKQMVIGDDLANKLALTGTPWMCITDSDRKVVKVQIGWTGVSDEDFTNTPWLLNIAANVIDRLPIKQ